MNSVLTYSTRTQDTFSNFLASNSSLIDSTLNAPKIIISELKNKIAALVELYGIAGSSVKPMLLDLLIERKLVQEDIYAYQDVIFSRLMDALDRDYEYVDIPDSIGSADDFYDWIQSL